MWKTSVHPAFGDVDGLGHINNCRLPVWFELGREPIYGIFMPELDPTRVPLIVARITVDYISQMKYGKDIEFHTFIKKIGRTSLTAYQEAYQNGILTAKGETVLVHFDYEEQKTLQIPEKEGAQLLKHMIDPDHPGLRSRSGRFQPPGK